MDCNRDEEADGDGDECGGRAMATAAATKRMMAMATTVADNEEGNGDDGKSNGDGDEGGRRAN